MFNIRKYEKANGEKKIINKLTNANYYITYIISKMINDNNKKFNYLSSEFKKVSLSSLIIDISINGRDEDTKKFYKYMISKYFKKTKIQAIKNIAKYSNENIISATNEINSLIENAMKSAFFIEIEKMNNILDSYEEKEYIKNYVINYVFDTIATAVCIEKILSLSESINQLEQDSEFKKIIINMYNEFGEDYNLIYEKSKPLYDQFYTNQLPLLQNDTLYTIALLIICSEEKNKSLLTNSNLKKYLNLGNKFDNIESFNIEINKLIYNWSKSDKINKNIDILLVLKIIDSIDPSNLYLYFEVLGEIEILKTIYFNNLDYNKKLKNKERYLNKNFEQEKKEKEEKFNLNNITTGTQFELYLTNLFKELGYKTKHNGKSGDQGADIILKKDSKIYAIQAKFYNKKLDNTPIQEIAGALKYYNANQGVVVTNSSFTKGAEDLAKANNIILIDGKNLKKLVDLTFEKNNDDIFKLFT